MEKKEVIECLEKAYEIGKKLLGGWNDYKMQQIRLETANLHRIEQSKQAHDESMAEKYAKHMRSR